MYLPKTDILNALKTITNVTVVQGSQSVFNDIPAITFQVGNNDVNLDLDNEIASQDLMTVVDVWADDSPSASALLSQAEAALRGLGYRLSFSTDVPNPSDPTLYHINARFEQTR